MGNEFKILTRDLHSPIHTVQEWKPGSGRKVTHKGEVKPGKSGLHTTARPGWWVKKTGGMRTNPRVFVVTTEGMVPHHKRPDHMRASRSVTLGAELPRELVASILHPVGANDNARKVAKR